MRWTTTKEQHAHMKKMQSLNQSATERNVCETQAHDILKRGRLKWTRQAQWGCRIFDFWCAEKGIAIEIDGKEHDVSHDNARDKYNYYRSGILVMRVANYDLDGVRHALTIAENECSLAERKSRIVIPKGKADRKAFLNKVGLKKAHGEWKPA